MITLEESVEPDIHWNKRLLDSTTGSTFQTKEFADYVLESFNAQTLFLRFLTSDGNIVGQIMLYVPENKKQNSFLKKIFKKKICRWTYGPVIFDNNYTSEIMKNLTNYLKHKIFLLNGSEHPLNPNIFNYMKNTFTIKPWSTFLIDLNQDKNTIWNKLDKHSARKNILRSKNKNVVVKMMERNDLSLFNELRNEKINNKEHVSLSVLQLHWDKLKPIGWNGFMAFHENIPVGGIMFSCFNGYINESGIVRSQIDFDLKLYAQDFLKWKIIEWGKENNQRFYDLTGINPNPKTDKELGIFRYKKKWGGDLINYNLIGG